MTASRIHRLSLTHFRNYRGASLAASRDMVALVGPNGAGKTNCLEAISFLSPGKLVLSVTNPDSGSATEEIEVEYASDALDIGFNSRYLMDIAAQIEGDVAVLRLADPGSPTLIQDKNNSAALYVLMPMRV